MEDQLPFRAEYAKSGRALCKECKEAIGQGTLRLGVMGQSALHDGKQPNWFHALCFFKKQRSVQVGDIAYYLNLKRDDQKMIEEQVAMDATNAKCRVCLTPDVNSGSPLFDVFYNELRYCDIIILIASIEIKPNDGLPGLLCKSCVDRASDAYHFRTQCINADKMLKSKKNEQQTNINVEILENYVKVEGSDDNSNDADYNPLDEPDDDIVADVKPQRSKRQHKCEICSKVFDKPWQLLRHASVHNANGKEFECGVCHRFFAARGSLLKHTATAHPDQYQSEVEDDDNGNVKSKRTKRHNKCEICSKVFDKPWQLLRHASVHNVNNKEFECDVCHRFFAAYGTLLKHRLKVHPNHIQSVAEDDDHDTMASIEHSDDNIQDESATNDRITEKQDPLASHMRIHKSTTSMKQYKCDYCPQEFTELNLLTRHSKSHDEMKIFKCHLCPESFGSRPQLVDHTNKHNGVKPYGCPVCEKKFHSSTVLNQHIKIHTNEEAYLCSQCGKGFKSYDYLKKHMIRHLGEKLFACPQCPNKYGLKSELKYHLNSHSGIKPYVCEICGSSYTKRHTLTVHKRKHSGEKPFGCNTCPKRFILFNHLRRHLRVHTGEKPYKCQHCDRAFAQSYDLIRHTRSHGTNIYKCDKCEATFRLHGELKKHIQAHFLAEKESKKITTAMETEDKSIATNLNKLIN